ncbi:MAG: glycosyltransferase family 4 protein [Fervidobacterium sp.]|uniref:glycosyltransferase family 4 protein n=1 Tax=Fervidobacterium TaxID=2422 RepID=UPI001436B450|nr:MULTISPECIES: glycosyltransferase family 1 protein [Fervidobacterium]NPU89511.1 glycosyltransferase family 4 protein [Fervidobacterium sp.]QIV77632.1 glycosyltransferase family 4 protein [Fervidobacterium pennivorans subsp. keratinolyticus]
MVIINGKFLAQKTTGVQRVAFEIVKRLDLDLQFLRNTDLRIVSPKKLVNTYVFKNIPHIKKGNGSPFWEYTILSIEAAKHRAHVFSFSSGFPITVNSGLYFMHDVTFLRVPESFSRGFRMLYRSVFKYVEAKERVIVLTNSEFSKREILSFFPKLNDRIYVVPIGHEHVIDVPRRQEILEALGLEPRSYYLTVATLNRHKNLGIVIQAARIRRKERFVVVGMKPSVTVFKEANILDVPDNVLFTGYLSDNDLVTLLENSKGLIFPSIYEGFGLPALEALALDVPLILSDIPVFREIYGEVACFFNPHDEKELAKKIGEASTPSRQARAKVLSTYSWERSVKTIIDIWLTRSV